MPAVHYLTTYAYLVGNLLVQYSPNMHRNFGRLKDGTLILFSMAVLYRCQSVVSLPVPYGPLWGSAIEVQDSLTFMSSRPILTRDVMESVADTHKCK